jgi:squalene-hopene/tetraprenyl-beta-curcumene cyclase
MPSDAIDRLPVELAAVPRGLHRLLRLEVVSYALPALIAIGHLQRTVRRGSLGHRGGRVPILERRALELLTRLQPATGGFLEAIPLTAFVLMSLSAAGSGNHPVIERGLPFLRETRRADGSWAIDRDLSTWVTSLSIQALSQAAPGGPGLPDSVLDWLSRCQWRRVHPFTNSAPGGWGWTDREGGVPDVDDTSGALLALRALGAPADAPAAADGVRWLLGLQNRDGGWPTFCRGWTRLPFDRSTPDLTAHAMRALETWGGVGGRGTERALQRARRYLAQTQRPDGSWVPLWFGHQSAPGLETPVYGTALVLRALPPGDPLAVAGITYLLRAANADGGWGGAPGTASSNEETGAAVTALVPHAESGAGPELAQALERAESYIVRQVQSGAWQKPSPIGLYFARLWYSERLYPLIWTVSALGSLVRARR